MDILAKLGIDPAVMIAQAVNFFVLLGLLSFFVYRPITKALDERKKRVAEADKNAEKIEAQLEKAEKQTAEELATAQQKASEIISAAKDSAKETEEQLVAEAQQKVEKIVDDGRAQIVRESDEASAKIQGEVAKIVTLATEKLLGRELKAKDQAEIVKEAAKEIESAK